jgi:branched-chain amino acid transport system substrate-binding protein
MRTTAFTALCLLLAAGCGREGRTIRIATQSPLSGAQAVIGNGIRNGADLALQQNSGPLARMGFTVKLAPFDDLGDPDTGVANAVAMVADPSVLGVVGHYNSGVQIPSAEEYHAAHLCNLSPANTNPKVTDRGFPEINRIVGRDDVLGAVAAQFASSRGVRSAYVLHDLSAYGEGIAGYFRNEAATQGVKLAGFKGTDETTDFGAVLSPILAARPDCIFFGGYFDQAALLFRQARQRGYTGMCLSDGGFDSPEAARIGTAALLQGAGTFFSAVSGPAAAYPGAGAFSTDYRARFGEDPQPYSAQAYDCAAVLLQAVENASRNAGGRMPTREEVGKAVRALQNFHGITGSIAFNRRGDLVMAKYFIIQVTSADPGKWAANRIDQTFDIAPPN